MINLSERYIFHDPHITAGSGLVFHDGAFYVVADDELCLFSLREDFSQGMVHKVFPGVLPQDHRARKKRKPDIEALIVLGNELLLIPSGSKDNRHQGAIVTLNNFQVKVLSFERTYRALSERIPDLNIEGAVAFEDKIRLFQRGNGKSRQNAVIDLEVRTLLQDGAGHPLICDVDLGHLNETPLSFTDATMYGDKMLFLAAAERTESTYEDGEFAGAVIGLLNRDNHVLKTWPLNINSKPEGICVKGDEFYLVTDDDDREKPSRLLSGSLSSLLVDEVQ